MPANQGPSIWAASDGRAGNAAQVRAIARALGDPQRAKRLAHISDNALRDAPMTLTPRAPWTWLPSPHWPAPKWALPPHQRDELAPPWPTVWLGAGRRTAPYSMAIKHWSMGQTYVVHILDPRCNLRHFDLVVTPEHDGLEGANVLSTIGSPSYFAPSDQDKAAQLFPDLAQEKRRSAIVILGGNSKTHTFSAQSAERLLGRLQHLVQLGWCLRITASRRTPVEISTRFRAFAATNNGQFWSGEADGPNPYLAWLRFSDAAIVTEDSANMLSDAAYHGLPVHMVRLEGRSAKFDRFHASLVRRNVATWFGDEIELWPVSPLREADRVADRIVDDLLARHPLGL